MRSIAARSSEMFCTEWSNSLDGINKCKCGNITPMPISNNKVNRLEVPFDRHYRHMCSNNSRVRESRDTYVRLHLGRPVVRHGKDLQRPNRVLRLI